MFAIKKRLLYKPEEFLISLLFLYSIYFQYNTLFDSLLKSCCYTRIFLNALFVPLDSVRFWVGPIPEIVSELGISIAAALVMVSFIQHSEMQSKAIGLDCDILGLRLLISEILTC